VLASWRTVLGHPGPPSPIGRARTRDRIPYPLTAASLVLATTKDRAHRICLHEGIHAEVTLLYERGGFRPLPWTYPDYRSAEVRSFFERARGLILAP